MKIQLIRNATLRLTYAGKTILIDPMLTHKHVIRSFAGISENPTVDLPMTAESVIADIDAVLISHLHPDHFDPMAQEMLNKELPLFCPPAITAGISEMGFNNLLTVEESITWEGITITRTVAQHGYGKLADMMGPVSGFIFTAEGEPSLYLMSDTVWYDGVEQLLNGEQPDVIITHSGGATFKAGDPPIIMDLEQTIQVAEAVANAQVIAVHLESLDHCPVTREQLRTAAAESGIANRFHAPEDGETIELA